MAEAGVGVREACLGDASPELGRAELGPGTGCRGAGAGVAPVSGGGWAACIEVSSLET